MPIILIRNLDFSRGLANGTRLIILRLFPNVIRAKVMTGAPEHVGTEVFIPRIPLKPSDKDSRNPIVFTRKQVGPRSSVRVRFADVRDEKIVCFDDA